MRRNTNRLQMDQMQQGLAAMDRPLNKRVRSRFGNSAPDPFVLTPLFDPFVQDARSRGHGSDAVGTQR
jgi:hypothetical protein